MLQQHFGQPSSGGLKDKFIQHIAGKLHFLDHQSGQLPGQTAVPIDQGLQIIQGPEVQMGICFRHQGYRHGRLRYKKTYAPEDLTGLDLCHY